MSATGSGPAVGASRLSDFDRRLVAQARSAGDDAYDAERGLIVEDASYNPIHTGLWTGQRHPHRESLVYALALLETGGTELAHDIITRVTAAQDKNPASSTYGIWSYYAEEPLSQMRPPDWNWADFLGRELALILLRHPSLDERVGQLARESLHHSAQSIIRRNVKMSYTNIAAKGTFVTLAAGQLLGDQELQHYGRERIGRLREQITEAGSFAEYNSPGYWAVSLEAVTAIEAHVDDPEAREVARWILDKLWAHVAARWHPSTGQLSGPMARAYTDDQAHNPSVLALLAKGTDFVPPFDQLPPLTATLSLLHPAILPVRAPDEIRAQLGEISSGTVVEQFSRIGLGGLGAAVPVVGTTWRTPRATLGSVSSSEFWLQRRPVLGYWAEPGDRPWQAMRCVRLQMLKDGKDFSSGHVNTVQHDGAVLWAAGLVSPGGDEHIHLDTIEPGTATSCSSLELVLTVRGAQDAEIDVDGRDPDSGGPVSLPALVTVRTPAVTLRLGVDRAVFGDHDVSARLDRDEDGLTLRVSLLEAGENHTVVLSDYTDAALVGTVTMVDRADGEPAEHHPVAVLVDGGIVEATWERPSARSWIQAPTAVLTVPRRLARVQGGVERHPDASADGTDRARGEGG